MKVIFITIFIGLIAATIAVFGCSNENELIPNPDDCTSFFSCENGFPILKTCPLGLKFDVDMLRCTDPTEASCAEPEYPEGSTTHEPTSSEKPTPPVECPEQQSLDENVLLPNPLDCGSYYQCIWGTPVLQKCPRGLHFNNKLKLCDRPINDVLQVSSATFKNRKFY